MVNDITTNPIIVDTADATAEIISYSAMVSSVRWVADATANDQAVIQDGNGNVKWSSLASGVNYVEAEKDFEPHLWIQDGLVVPTLESGTLYITIV